MNEILTVDNLRKTFKLSKKQQQLRKTKDKVITAVDGVSFSAYEGEVFGLLGPNGAGKTTTLRMLATLINPDSGDATVGGLSVVREAEEVRKRIGFLTNELKMDEYFTPNYLFDFFSQLHGIPKDAVAGRKKLLFEKFGIDKFAEVKVGNLSSGMKQKTSLVISIVHDPSISIFDEPTNGLDVITSKVVTDFLAELKAQGKSIILSSHIFSLVEDVCDRVGIIIDGRLAVCDSIATLTKDKPLEDYFFDVYRDTTGEEI
jgi:sodium transport system ATP-binding protein